MGRQYWITDPVTTDYARVDSAAERDVWLASGWSVVDEPTGVEQVWVRHPDVELPGRLAAIAINEVWQHKGWEPCAPPASVYVQPPAPTAAPAESTTPAATSGDSIEEGTSA
ncbi:hypothetical protein [Actinoplanes sp. NPDC051851]|uniref:hypothetical protein n=1 Tax=Actinoplanes sp. NPDC051851 TaxID=3154753 RepID=UPI00343CD183